MKSIFPSKIIDFYKKETELNIIFFKLLGTAGIIISFAGAISSFFTGSDPANIFINIGAAIASAALIIFVVFARNIIIRANDKVKAADDPEKMLGEL